MPSLYFNTGIRNNTKGYGGMLDIDTCIGFITNKAGKKMGDAFNERLMQFGVTRIQWVAMYYLLKNKNLIQRSLADKMDIKESTVVRLIDRMEKDGLVERTKDSSDRRVTYLNLTQKGEGRIEELIPEGEKMSDIFSNGISEEEIKVFNKVLKKMLENISL